MILKQTCNKPLPRPILNLTQGDFELSVEDSKNISDRLYEKYDLDIAHWHISKILKEILYISGLVNEYKNYEEVVNNLDVDMYNINYLNALIIAFNIEHGIFWFSNNAAKYVITYEKDDNLEDECIVKVIKCMLEYIKETSLKFYPWN